MPIFKFVVVLLVARKFVTLNAVDTSVSMIAVLMWPIDAKRFVDVEFTAITSVDVATVVDTPIALTTPVPALKVNSADPPNVPLLLNWICVFAPPGVPAPPEPKQMPFTDTQPPVTAMPPEKLDVALPVTVTVLSVVVPLSVAPEIVLPVMFEFAIVPWSNVDPLIATLPRVSIRLVCAITL